MIQEPVTCPWCQHRFAVDPVSTAGDFACPECKERSTLGSLRDPNLNPAAIELARIRAIASTENLNRHSLVYKFIDRRDQVGTGSGTLVEIGGRYFVATVKHTHPRELASISLVKKSGLMIPGSNSFVRHRSKCESHDVAFFELEDSAPAAIGVEPITLARVHDCGTGVPNLGARIFGYPDRYQKPDYPTKGMLGFHALSYGCEPIEPSRWQAIPYSSFDPDSHVVFDFNPDVLEWSPELPLPKGLPPPPGMSGGGLWQRRAKVRDGELWSADELNLIAIQAFRIDGTSFLVATQVIHWLRLVAEKRPELRSEIARACPRL
jgi:hypothetical protein